MKWQRIFVVGTLGLMMFGYQNCAKQQFGSGGGSSSATTSGAPTASGTPIPASATINQGSEALPTAVFIGPPCARGSACTAAFRLDSVEAHDVSLHWQTNDSLYLTPAPAGQPIYGRPGYHYVSTSGDVTIPAGQQQVGISIQNINPDNVSIIIGVVMTNCMFDGQSIDCSKMFH